MKKGKMFIRLVDFMIYAIMVMALIFAGVTLGKNGLTWRFYLLHLGIGTPAGVYIFNRIDILHYYKEEDRRD